MTIQAKDRLCCLMNGFIVVALVVGASGCAFGTSRRDFGVGYTYVRHDRESTGLGPNSGNLNGFLASYAGYVNWFGWDLEGGGNWGSVQFDSPTFSGTGSGNIGYIASGPRVMFRHDVGRVAPYAQFLLALIADGANPGEGSRQPWSYLTGGGIDYRLGPGVSLRTGGDYWPSANTVRKIRLQVSVVVRDQ